jgi:dGTP triphosphohydrolase
MSDEDHSSLPLDSRQKLVEKILKDLYAYVLENPEGIVKPFPEEDPLEVRALDVIAGMTDLYALRWYEELFSQLDWPST